VHALRLVAFASREAVKSHQTLLGTSSAPKAVLLETDVLASACPAYQKDTGANTTLVLTYQVRASHQILLKVASCTCSMLGAFAQLHLELLLLLPRAPATCKRIIAMVLTR
jgi:hypothetical protein